MGTKLTSRMLLENARSITVADYYMVSLLQGERTLQDCFQVYSILTYYETMGFYSGLLTY